MMTKQDREFYEMTSYLLRQVAPRGKAELSFNPPSPERAKEMVRLAEEFKTTTAGLAKAEKDKKRIKSLQEVVMPRQVAKAARLV
jgi:hypothetical protein